MKKLLLLLGLIVVFAIQSFASEKEVFLSLKTTSKSQTNIPVHRSPIRFPQINVIFNPDENIIVIESSESIDVDVFLYDADGNVVDYSNTLNTTFQLLSNGEYTLYIEADSWYAIGYIN